MTVSPMGATPTRRHFAAAMMIWLWMAMVAVFITTAILQAPAEKRTLAAVLGMTAINACLLSFAGWAALGVLRGARMNAALGVLVLYGIAALVALLLLLGFGGGYTGTWYLPIAMALDGLAWLLALIAVWRAMYPRPAR